MRSIFGYGVIRKVKDRAAAFKRETFNKSGSADFGREAAAYTLSFKPKFCVGRCRSKCRCRRQYVVYVQCGRAARDIGARVALGNAVHLKYDRLLFYPYRSAVDTVGRGKQKGNVALTIDRHLTAEIGAVEREITFE